MVMVTVALVRILGASFMRPSMVDFSEEMITTQSSQREKEKKPEMEKDATALNSISPALQYSIAQLIILKITARWSKKIRASVDRDNQRYGSTIPDLS